MAQDLSSIVESPQPERLATGFVFTEGPLWHPEGYLLFVDIRRNLIFKLASGGEPEVVRDNSGGSNGLTFDLQGRLLMCEGNNRRITCMESDGTVVPIVERVDGKRLNRPNDIVGRSDGGIYFTDPAGPTIDPSVRDLDFTGVHRIAPDGTVSTVISEGFEFPNGIAFSPDESVLYVNNTRKAMQILAYDVQPDGSVTNARVFADMGIDDPPPPEPGKPTMGSSTGVPDGMKVDVEGRVYCTGPEGHWVFDSSGNHLGTIKLPEMPANCAWGGPDNQTMFFTARTSVYSIRMKTPGTSVPRAE